MRLWAPLNIELLRISPGRKIGDHFIPRGSNVSISSYTTIRDLHVFPDPEAFIPVRWLDATPEMRIMSKPFSTGPRNCVGKHSADANLTLALTRTFQLFDLTVDPVMTDDRYDGPDQ